jgi:beta-galactosidase/beta-glucuronidase
LRIVKFTALAIFILHFAFLKPAWTQSHFRNLYRPAAHAWLGEAPNASPRRWLPLNGAWQATCSSPKFSDTVAIPGAFLFDGEMRFERSFHLADSLRLHPLRLHVEGLNHEAQIAINGVMTASHLGGYLSFVTDLRDEHLRFGQDNALAITVDNRLKPMASLPPQHRPWGWRNEGGVMREIYLEILPQIYLADYEFKYDLQSDGVHLEFHAQARRGRDLPPELFKNLTATLEIWDLARLNKLASSAAQPLTAWQANRHEVRLSSRLSNPALWSPASPNLYALRVVLQQ